LVIYGDSKVGKTYVGVGKVKQKLKLDETATAWIFNTDMGFIAPAKEMGLNESPYVERIKYFTFNGIDEVVKIISDITPMIKPNDIIMFDLVSWIWEQSQVEYLHKVAGDNVSEHIQDSSKNKNKFGMFSGMEWSAVKMIDKTVTKFLTSNLRCSVIGITSLKDVSMEYAMNKKIKDIWCKEGKPAGRKDLMYEFSTIIKIDKRGKGKRGFLVVGTRNGDTDGTNWIDFTTAKDFWDKLEGKENEDKK